MPRTQILLMVFGLVLFSWIVPVEAQEESDFRLAAPHAGASSYPEYFYEGQTLTPDANAETGRTWVVTNAAPTGVAGPCVGVL